MSTANKHHFEFIQGSNIQALPAPKLKRILAYTVDVGLVSLVMYSLFFILFIVGAIFLGIASALNLFGGIQTWVSQSYDTGNVLNLILIVLLGFIFLLLFYALFFGPFHAYFIYHEYKNHTTPGKKIFGLQVITLDGQRLTLKDAILRDAMRHFEAMLILPPLISMLATEKSQRLGDLMTGTMVVHTPKDERAQDFIYIDEPTFRHFSDTLTFKKQLNTFDAQVFLKEAFPIFILKQLNPQEHQLFFSKASSIYHDYYDASSAPHFDDAAEKNNFLRFHAQRCFDLVNQL